MRTVMNLLGGFPAVLRPIYIPGRKKPFYYTDGRVSVLGHYESPCGGCDTIHGYETLISLARIQAEQGPVLMEGLLLSEDVKNSLTLPREALRVLFLDTQVSTCLERIKARRAVRGNDKELNPANTTNRVGTISRARARLEAAGVACQTVTCDQAPRLIYEWVKRH
jgi:hypothetical protein